MNKSQVQVVSKSRELSSNGEVPNNLYELKVSSQHLKLTMVKR